MSKTQKGEKQWDFFAETEISAAQILAEIIAITDVIIVVSK